MVGADPVIPGARLWQTVGPTRHAGASIAPVLVSTGSTRVPVAARGPIPVGPFGRVGASPRHLTIDEREKVLLGLSRGESLTAIAQDLGRAVSTVSWEVKRGGGRDGYSAWHAHERARHQARRPKPFRLVEGPLLAGSPVVRLERLWSPQEIAAASASRYSRLHPLRQGGSAAPSYCHMTSEGLAGLEAWPEVGWPFQPGQVQLIGVALPSRFQRVPDEGATRGDQVVLHQLDPATTSSVWMEAV